VDAVSFHNAPVSIVRAAVVQAAPVAFDRERALEKVASLVADAAGRGAELVVFPEALVSAYPKGSTFGAVVGSRTSAGRDEFKRYWDSAVDVPAPDVDQLSELARSMRIHLVVPVIQRGEGTMYCTALFFSPEAYLGKHRKLMPTAGERLVWGFGDGSTLPVFDTVPGASRQRHLLGELHANAPDDYVLKGHPVLLRSHRRRPGDLAIDRAPHRVRRTLLRLVVLSVRPPKRLPRGLCDLVRQRSGRGADAWRELHRWTVGECPC